MKYDYKLSSYDDLLDSQILATTNWLITKEILVNNPIHLSLTKNILSEDQRCQESLNFFLDLLIYEFIIVEVSVNVNSLDVSVNSIAQINGSFVFATIANNASLLPLIYAFKLQFRFLSKLNPIIDFGIFHRCQNNLNSKEMISKEKSFLECFQKFYRNYLVKSKISQYTNFDIDRIL